MLVLWLCSNEIVEDDLNTVTTLLSISSLCYCSPRCCSRSYRRIRTFTRQRRSGSNLQCENGCCSSVGPMQGECSAAFTWRLMDFSTADGWWGGQDRACDCWFGKPCDAAAQSERRMPKLRGRDFQEHWTRLEWWLEATRLKWIHPSGPYHTCACICTAAAAVELLRTPQADALRGTRLRNCHIPAHTLRTLTDAQAAEFWQLISTRRQGHSYERPFLSSFPKAPRPANLFPLSLSHWVICRSTANLATVSLCHWSEYIVGLEAHHSQRLFLKAEW